MSGWKDNPGTGVAKYAFTATASNQLSLKVGERVEIKQEQAGWYRGWLESNPGQVQIFPKDYVKFTPAPPQESVATPENSNYAPLRTASGSIAPPQTQFQPPRPALPKPAPPSASLPATSGGPPSSFPSSASGTIPPRPTGGPPAPPASSFVPPPSSSFARPSVTPPAPPNAGLPPGLKPNASGGGPPAPPRTAQFGSSPSPPSSGPPAFGGRVPPPISTGPPATPARPAAPATSSYGGGSPGFGASAPPPQQIAGLHVRPNALNLNNNNIYVPLPISPVAGAAPSGGAPPPFVPTTAPLPLAGLVASPRNGAGPAPPGPASPPAGPLPTYVPGGDSSAPSRGKQAKAAAAAALAEEAQGQFQVVVHQDTREEDPQGGIILLKDPEGRAAAVVGEDIDPVSLADGLRLADPTLGAQVAFQGAGMPLPPSGSGANPAARLRAQQREASSSFSAVDAHSRLYQLFLEVKVCIFSVGEETDMVFSLYNATKKEFVTDEFIVNLPPPGVPDHMRVLGRMKTVFENICPADITEDTWLVCRIFRKGGLIYEPKEMGKPTAAKVAEKGTTCRRCFGAAVTQVSSANLFKSLGKEYEPPASSLTIYTPTSEALFPHFHDLLINAVKEDALANNKDFELAPRAKGIALGLTLFEGTAPVVRFQNKALLKDSAATQKPNFARAWNPSQPRNDYYVRLVSGSFSQDKKSSARNVEVRVKLMRTSTMTEVPNSVYTGMGAEVAPNTYCSGVYYHSNTPEFNEMIKITATPTDFADGHLLFEFWHVSTTAKKSAIFSSAFFPLADPATGAIVSSGIYPVSTYRPFNIGEAYVTEADKIPARKESIVIETQLCSSILSEHAQLQQLSQWRTMPRPTLISVLNALASPMTSPVLEAVARVFPTALTHICGIIGSVQHADAHPAAFQLLIYFLSRLAPDYSNLVWEFATDAFADGGASGGRIADLTAEALRAEVDAMASASATALSGAATPGGSSGDMSMSPGFGATGAAGNRSASRSLARSTDSFSIAPSAGSGGMLSPGPAAGGGSSRLSIFVEENPETPRVAHSPSGGGALPPPPPPPPQAEAMDVRPVLRLGRAVPLAMALVFSSYARSSKGGAPSADAVNRIKNLLAAAEAFVTHDVDIARSPASASAQAAVFSALPRILAASIPFLGEAGALALAGRWLSVPVSPATASAQVTAAITILIGRTSTPVPIAPAGKGTLPFTSPVRALMMQPASQLPRVLPAAHLATILPSLLTLAGEALGLGVRTESLDEIYLGIALLHHLVGRAHPRSALRARLVTSPAHAAEMAAGTTLANLLPVLGNLAAAVDLVFRSCPSVTLPRSEAGSHVSLAPASDVTVRMAYVDVLLDGALLLFTILGGVPSPQLNAYLGSFSRENLGLLLRRVLFVAHSCLALSGAPAPEAWAQIQLFLLRSAVTVLISLAGPVRSQFSSQHFDPSVWVSWLRLSLLIRQSRCLQPELVPAPRAIFMTERYGDMRRGVPELFAELWTGLSDAQKVQTAVALADQIVCAIVVVPSAVRLALFDVFFDLLCAEFRVSGDFAEMERLTVDALYEVADTSSVAGEKTMDLLRTTCGEKFRTVSDPRLAAAGQSLMVHMQAVFQLMLSLLALPDTPEYQEDRASVALRLIAYIESTTSDAAAASADGARRPAARRGMHSRYVQFLAELHMKSGNHVEAAVTLLQQAKLLPWGDGALPSSRGHPAETERSRKERLLKIAIQAFTDAGEWERASECIGLLVHYYQHLVFNYSALAAVLRMQANLFVRMAEDKRFYSAYFRVLFHGQFDDPTLTANGGEFVYKGETLDNIMEFTNRLKLRFPTAHYAMTDRPAPELLRAHKQVIAVTILNVPPAAQAADLLSTLSSQNRLPPLSALPALAAEAPAPAAPLVPMPMHVARHKDNHGVRVFEYSRVWRRSNDKNVNEFRDMWIARTFVVVAEPFPSNRRRIPVVERVEVTIPPVVNATETIENKTRELELIAATVAQAAAGQVDVGPLSMILNGMIDAAVNGGTSKYIEAFLTPAFLDASTFTLDSERADPVATAEERRVQIQALKAVLARQIKVLRRALDVFGARCSESLHGLHTHLCSFYDKMVEKTAPVLA